MEQSSLSRSSASTQPDRLVGNHRRGGDGVVGLGAFNLGLV